MSWRTVEQLQAWRDLIELCEDDCQVFRTTEAMRSAVMEVERELGHLHQIETSALALARILKHVRVTAPGEGEWDHGIDMLFDREATICGDIERLCPEAFTPEAMVAATGKPP